MQMEERSIANPSDRHDTNSNMQLFGCRLEFVIGGIGVFCDDFGSRMGWLEVIGVKRRSGLPELGKFLLAHLHLFGVFFGWNDWVVSHIFLHTRRARAAGLFSRESGGKS